ncbi:hypothetical protein AB3S75_012977 [Citrus x aurantiifolia]
MGLCAGNDLMLVGLNAMLMLLCFLLNRRSVLAVVRNSDGTFLAAKCDSFAGGFGAREAEAFGVREALSWLKNQRLPRVVIKLDFLQVFKVLTENRSSPNGFGLIVEQYSFLAQNLGEVKFSIVCRSANATAHSVDRVGGFMSGPKE